MKRNYLGALHIHSTYSDGTKDIDYIISQAKKAGLNWIIITDHNDMRSIKHEGFYGGVCVIAGLEVTQLKGNHLLAFGVNEVIDENIGVRNYIDEVHKQGGICFPAHADESIKRDNKHVPLRWDDWSIDTFDGLEVWNYLTDWTDNYSIHKNSFLQYFTRHKMIKGPTKNLLAWWDRLNIRKNAIVPAIGGVDAHAFCSKKRYIPFKIADYHDYFSSLNNLITLDEPLSKTFNIAKQQIISAIKNGNNTILNRQACNDINVEIYASNKDRKFYPGETFTLGKYSHLDTNLPKKATIRVIHNGVQVYETVNKTLHYDKLDIGKYRIEVYDKNMPWVFSNPINIIGEQNAYNNRNIIN